MAVFTTSVTSSKGDGVLGVTGSGGLYLDAVAGSVLIRGAATTNQGQLTASLGMSIPDDIKLRFGSATGDVTLRYDESSSDTLAVDGNVSIIDDKLLYFGTGKDASIEYDEDGTDELRFAGAAVTFEQDVTFDEDVTLGLNATDVVTIPAQLTASEGMLVADNEKIYFGDSVESHIRYDEANDDYLVISGSSSGVGISGSLVNIDGVIRYTGVASGSTAGPGSYLCVTTEGNVVIDTVAAASGDITGVTAGVGLSGGGNSGGVTLTLDLSEIVEETGTTGPNVADFVPFTDTSDSNNTKKTTVAHLLSTSGSTHSGSTATFDTVTAGENIVSPRFLLPQNQASASIFCQQSDGKAPMLVFNTANTMPGGMVIFGDSTGSAGSFAVVPAVDNAFDLGMATKRWRNIYTGDLHLANDRGDWTVIEESDYLTLRNNKNGKRFKLVMQELQPGEYGPGNDTGPA